MRVMIKPVLSVLHQVVARPLHIPDPLFLTESAVIELTQVARQLLARIGMDEQFNMMIELPVDLFLQRFHFVMGLFQRIEKRQGEMAIHMQVLTELLKAEVMDIDPFRCALLLQEVDQPVDGREIGFVHESIGTFTD